MILIVELLETEKTHILEEIFYVLLSSSLTNLIV